MQESDLERIYEVLREKHDSALITYKELCERAGVPNLTRHVGTILAEIAERCQKRGLPPINSLAVNAKTKKPGPGYRGAAGCSEENWKDEVGACLSRKYPPRIP